MAYGTCELGLAPKEIGGHQTNAMHAHYQTLTGVEQKAEIGKVVTLLERPKRVGGQTVWGEKRGVTKENSRPGNP